MNTNDQNKGASSTKLHHTGGRNGTAGQFLYIRNADHEKSAGMKWVRNAFSKATLGAVRALTQNR